MRGQTEIHDIRIRAHDEVELQMIQWPLYKIARIQWVAITALALLVIAKPNVSQLHALNLLRRNPSDPDANPVCGLDSG